MAITIQNDSDQRVNTVELKRFAGRTERMIGLKGDIAVLITRDARMREFNRWYRQKNYATDVLSFPGSGQQKHAGDIAISSEIAAVNAEALGHSHLTELKVLILHGLLHLSGYDHEADSGEMAGLEDHLRSRLGLPNALISRTISIVRGKKSGAARKPAKMVSARAAASGRRKIVSRGRSATHP